MYAIHFEFNVCQSVSGVGSLDDIYALEITTNKIYYCKNELIAGEFQIGENIKPLNPDNAASVVEYGKVKEKQTQKAEGYSLIYNQLYPYEGLQNYTSGIIHHVQLTG